MGRRDDLVPLMAGVWQVRGGRAVSVPLFLHWQPRILGGAAGGLRGALWALMGEQGLRGPQPHALGRGGGSMLALPPPHVGQRGQGPGRCFLVHAVTWRTLAGPGGAGCSETPLAGRDESPLPGPDIPGGQAQFCGAFTAHSQDPCVSRFVGGEGSRLWASLVSGRLQAECFWKPWNRRAECAALRRPEAEPTAGSCWLFRPGPDTAGSRPSPWGCGNPPTCPWRPPRPPGAQARRDCWQRVSISTKVLCCRGSGFAPIPAALKPERFPGGRLSERRLSTFQKQEPAC